MLAVFLALGTQTALAIRSTNQLDDSQRGDGEGAVLPRGNGRTGVALLLLMLQTFGKHNQGILCQKTGLGAYEILGANFYWLAGFRNHQQDDHIDFTSV